MTYLCVAFYHGYEFGKKKVGNWNSVENSNWDYRNKIKVQRWQNRMADLKIKKKSVYQ